MNREQWLNELMTKMQPILEQHTAGATKDIATWRVSCGWPGGGSRKTRIGECWSSTASKDGRVEIFISPLLEGVAEVDHVLLHEMVHAAVGVKHKHRGPFTKIARGVGMVGKITATTAGEELRKRLDAITATMPAYPHSGMTPMTNGIEKQTTRMIKLTADCCGYVVRTTQKWIDAGLPSCPCGNEFTIEEKQP